MYLKTLTLRGFKSFASATTLHLEPGITCVVGPNGSGKSNVVDALAWVMGEQGAKSLRGGKMEDVIFAGTAGRSPLGRAEVTLTIDNTDGALPIEYSEVTISRTLFRNGGSEYAINGASCRLLDIQDLLSDSGMGREMHVIVGQGRLDAILHASPEERRGFIEEAAGVLKHRKRKEKALRKLDAMQANLMRVTDLTAEIRRQLGPLGRQAEVARRAQTVQAEVRDARARLLADDLVQLGSSMAQDLADENALKQRHETLDSAFRQAKDQLTTLEKQASEIAPAYSDATQRWYTLSSIKERLRATGTLASERLRLLTSDVAPAFHSDRDPDELESQAERARVAERDLEGEVQTAQEALAQAIDARGAAETASATEDKRVTSLLRAHADQREGLAKLAGRVAAKQSAVEAAEAERGRLDKAVAEAKQRGEQSRAEFEMVEAEVERARIGLADRAVALQFAEEARQITGSKVTSLKEELRANERDVASLQARKDALELGLTRKDGAGALLAADGPVAGVLGSVATMMCIEPGYENAIAAALGREADAVVIRSLDETVAAVRYLRDEELGCAAAVIATDVPHVERGEIPPDSRWARELVTGADAVSAVLDALLADVAIVDDLTTARRLVGEYPGLRFVTRAGDLLGAAAAYGGSVSAPSVLELQAALDEALARLSSEQQTGEDLRARLDKAIAEEVQATAEADSVTAAWKDSDSASTAVSERFGQLGVTVTAADQEASRLEARLREADRQIDEQRVELTDLAARLREAEEAPQSGDIDDCRQEYVEAAAARRHEEMEARLALRTLEERMRALAGRAESLEKAATEERAARARAAEQARIRAKQVDTAQAVRAGTEVALAVTEQSIYAAARVREKVEAHRQAIDEATKRARAEVERLTSELSELTDVAHRDEVARAQQKLRIEQLEERALEELGVSAESLVNEFGPDKPVPPVLAADDADEPAPDPGAFVREEQEKRLKRAERQLSQLGRVNPLALEEYAALEERHQFLGEQLADLKKSRSDLLDIIREVDDRVEEVFTQAWVDTEREFRSVFATLFPGGEGKLILTDPENMLETGIEVEARPAGKKIKRLSLLSGGERSLTAVAMLVAIFKARPSPFYVMDEVEAALDDVNLGRLLMIFEELRESSQLIIVTHQKRTMEIADALYGVTMRGDGVTTVISQRLKDETEAHA